MDFLNAFTSNPEASLALSAGLLRGDLASGLLGFSQTMGAQKDRAMKAQLQQMQMEEQGLQLAELRRKMAEGEELRRAASSSMISPEQANAMSMGPTPDGGTVPQVAPGFDAKAYTNKLFGINPAQAIAFQQSLAKESTINKLDPKDFTPASLAKYAQTRNYADLVRLDKLHFADTGGTTAGLDPFTGEKRAEVANTGNPFKDLLTSDGAGGFKPNQPLIGAKLAIAKAGAPTTSVKVENKMGEGLATQVGPMMKESQEVAGAALKQADAANRIIQAVDSNKMYAGTGATIVMPIAQLASTLGVGGKDTAEKIANTRQAMQGLAQLTLQGRQQMKGQGAVTESEGALAQRAISGDINMTPAEIRQLANAAKRSADWQMREHQRKVDVMRANPSLNGLTPFYDVPASMGQSGPVDFGSLK